MFARMSRPGESLGLVRMQAPRWRGFEILALLLLALSVRGGSWWKGNLHTHSLWSDGDDYPEMIAEWYKHQGYHFLAFSEHNVMTEGTRWLTITAERGGGGVLARYLRRFGHEWVELRTDNGTNQVRLKPLAEFRSRFEEPDRFLLIPAEEITDRHLTAPVHLNAVNLKEFIAPQGGSNVVDVLQANVNAVLAQRERTGQPMFPHINHPNFGWAITAEEILQIRGERFFEVYNGHPSVRNEGDEHHASTERMWDIILSWRLGVLNLPVMYGLAVDDGHHYDTYAVGRSNPGRGWVMVRAPQLTPESIIQALEAGDFYASSGVTLRAMVRTGAAWRIEVAAEPGVTYRTRFIGTRRGFDRTNEPIRNVGGAPLRITHRYSDQVGEILAETDGPVAEYTLRGDELYVRAEVISTKPKLNPYRAEETEKAWLQPIQP